MNLPSNDTAVNPLAAIIAAANAAGRNVAYSTLAKTDAGSIILRADLRGYLLLELWPKGLGPTSRLTLAFWNWRAEGVWVASTTEEKAEAWLTEANAALGIEPLPAPVDPVDAVAADLVAEAGTDFSGRIDRAVELVKGGHTEFPQYETEYIPSGQTGHYECGCKDAYHRNLRWAYGVACKHSLALEINRRLSQQAEATATRKLSDRLEMARKRETAG